MADVIQFIDGFDHYQPSTEWQYKYNAQVNGVTQVSPGRFGAGQAMAFTTDGSIFKHIGVKSAAWRIGMAVYLTSVSTGNIAYLFTLVEDGVSHGGLAIIGSSRCLQFHRNQTLLGSPSSYAIPLSTWVYIEMYLVTSDSISSGHATVKVNGNTELTLAATTDTRNGGTAGTPNGVTIGSRGSWSVQYDDLVVSSMDTTTTPTFLGDKRVFTLYPSGDGNYSDFVGSDGNSTNNSLLVDESADINLTDYVEGVTAGDRDSYAIDNPALTPTNILAVAVNMCVAKADAGDRTYKPFVRISGTDYDQSTAYPSSSPQIGQTLMETSPATATAWTSSELNGLEAGVKIEA